MLEYIHAAVEAWPLAVPHAEDAVVFRARKQADLLAAPDRGHRQVLVDAGQEMNVVFFGEALRFPQRLVETAQRRAAVARNETGGVESAFEIALVLQDRQPDQRFDTGHEGAALVQRILVVERDFHDATGSEPVIPIFYACDSGKLLLFRRCREIIGKNILLIE